MMKAPRPAAVERRAGTCHQSDGALQMTKTILTFLASALLATAAQAQVPIKTIKIAPPTVLPPDPDKAAPTPPLWPRPAPSQRYSKQAPTLGMLQRRGLPPPEYDHAYEGTLTVKRVATTDAVKLACPNTPSPVILGCAKRDIYSNTCDVVIASDD